VYADPASEGISIFGKAKMRKNIDAGVLNVSYVELGDPAGWPVVLLHGFPYDIHAYDEVEASLVSERARVIVPYLRGYGPTRFLSEMTPRSGQQAALGSDLLWLIEALRLDRPILGGYDWGGRAACIVSALWPDRVRGLVSVSSYNIQNIATSGRPHDPEYEHRIWYQYYFHSERGRAGLREDRRRLCKLLWKLWSPSWNFTQAEFDRTAASFENVDFVDVVIQSYRHRFGLAAGDPELEEIERRLAAQPEITVPTIALDGKTDGVMPVDGTREQARKFTGHFEFRSVENAGHNLPQEAPPAFAQAILDVNRWTRKQ